MPEQATTTTTLADGSTVTDIHSSPVRSDVVKIDAPVLPSEVLEEAKSKTEPTNIDTLFVKLGELLDYRDVVYGEPGSPQFISARLEPEVRARTIFKLDEFFNWFFGEFPFTNAPSADDVRPIIRNEDNQWHELSYNMISTLTPELVQVVIFKALITAKFPEIPRSEGFKFFSKNYAPSILG